MAIDPILQSKLAIWRAKAADGTATLAEMKEAIICLRMGRKSAVEASAASKTRSSAKAKPTDKSVADMLDAIEGL